MPTDFENDDRRAKKVLEFLSVATDAICQDRSKKRGLVCAAYHRPDSPLAHASENYLQREASLASDAGCPHQRTSDCWSVLDVLGLSPTCRKGVFGSTAVKVPRLLIQ